MKAEEPNRSVLKQDLLQCMKCMKSQVTHYMVTKHGDAIKGYVENIYNGFYEVSEFCACGFIHLLVSQARQALKSTDCPHCRLKEEMGKAAKLAQVVASDVAALITELGVQGTSDSLYPSEEHEHPAPPQFVYKETK